MLHGRFLTSLPLFLYLFHLTNASLDQLRQLQRKCYTFRDISPCVMFMNEQRAFGCAQCGDDIRSEPLREFRSPEELILFIDSESEKRIVMIPEFIFFSSKVVGRLSAARTSVAAVIVFEGPGDAISVPEQPDGGPFEPIIVRSDDETEPNRRYNFYNISELPPRCGDEESTQKRNPNAVCYKNSFFPFSIFRVNASVANEIRFLAARFPDQNDRPLFGARNSTSPLAPRYKIQSVGQMFSCPLQAVPTPNVEEASEESATESELLVTSKRCLTDRTCLPIGGHSLWSSLGHLDRNAPSSNDILAITAPMDSIAFFNDFALGASAEITSLAIMMAVAAAVGEYRRGEGAKKPMLKHPVYFAWNAQSWGYAGSSRFLKDVSDFNCEEEADLTKFSPGCVKPYMPSLKFLDFRTANFSVLNIGQMISPNQTDVNITYKFFLHGRGPTENKGEVERALIDAFSDHERFGDNGVERGDEGGFTLYVPLDASQSFHRYRRDADRVTIANYKSKFTNKFYHSAFDEESRTANPQEFRAPMYFAAEAIASSVVSLAFGDNVSLRINRTVIDQIVICLTGNGTGCELGREYVGKFFESIEGNIVAGNYPGSFFPLTRLREENPSAAAKLNLIRSFFAYHNRYKVPEKETPCETVDDCDDFIKAINTRVVPTSHSQLRSVFCTRGRCVASDTYTHNAFGTALNATNDAQSSFQYDESKEQVEFDGLQPQEAGWTESVWDPDLGFCSFVEDTGLYGGVILIGGFLVLFVSVGISFWLDRVMFVKSPEMPGEIEPLPQATSV